MTEITNMVAIANLNRSIIKLDKWITLNGWAGYDPYDIKGTGFFRRLLQPRPTLAGRLFSRMIASPILKLEAFHPQLARKIFHTPPTYNAKAMGLFARGYLQLFQSTGEEHYRDKAIQCLDWLMKNPSQGYSGICWGYPFDWQSKIFIPKGTPSSVVSSVVGDAFWTAWKVLGERRYLTVCTRICSFFVGGLNRDNISDDMLCFSYTPLDDFHVHNANLFVAEFLVRIGTIVDRPEWVELGLFASNYALCEQNPDGSLNYWGKIQNHYRPNFNDHYHIGFEIRALYGISNSTGYEKYFEAYRRYYSFYLQNLIQEDEGLLAPRMSRSSFYPVNIHSCAEALLLNATLASKEIEARRVVWRLTKWVIDKMQTEEGWFIYLRDQARGREISITIPYIRWGQGWMLLALSQCNCIEKT